MKRICAMLLAGCLSVSGAFAGDEALRRIAVTGLGQVDAPPDMAMITLGVTEEASGAAEAMAATSDALGRILQRLERLGLAARDVQTQRITLNPVWSNARYDSGKPPVITGFMASSMVAIRVRELDRLGEVLDSVIADGANEFSGLRFSVAEPGPLMEEARRRAVADAMARAALLAEAAGVTLGAVRSIDDHGGGSSPMMMEMAAERSAAMPIASGEVSLSASVAMVFDIAASENSDD